MKEVTGFGAVYALMRDKFICESDAPTQYWYMADGDIQWKAIDPQDYTFYDYSNEADRWGGFEYIDDLEALWVSDLWKGKWLVFDSQSDTEKYIREFIEKSRQKVNED